MHSIVYSSNRPPSCKGWDDFDLLVLLTVADLPGQSLADVTRRVPAGISTHLVRQSLKVLIADGLVAKASRRFVVDPSALVVEFEVRTVYELSEAGAERLGRAQKAA